MASTAIVPSYPSRDTVVLARRCGFPLSEAKGNNATTRVRPSARLERSQGITSPPSTCPNCSPPQPVYSSPTSQESYLPMSRQLDLPLKPPRPYPRMPFKTKATIQHLDTAELKTIPTNESMPCTVLYITDPSQERRTLPKCLRNVYIRRWVMSAVAWPRST